VSILAPAERVEWAHRRIVFPIGIVTALLYVLGFLDDVLTYRSEILQAGTIGLIYVLSSLPVPFLTQQLERLQAWIVKPASVRIIPLLKNLAPILQSGLRPLSAWVLCALAIGIFDGVNAGTNVLRWAAPFFAIWFGYEIIHTFIVLSFSSTQAHVFSRALRITALTVAVLHAIDLWVPVWEFGLLRLRENVSLQLGAAIIGVLIIYVSTQLSRNTRLFLRETLPQVGVNLSLTHILATLGAYVIIVCGVLIALNEMRFDLSALAVILGGFSVGIGFALESIIVNFLSGFILLFEGSISIGDMIQVGEEVGIVEEVTLRSMRIRTLDNIELTVPNERFLTNVVTNYSGNDRRICIHLTINVSPDADPHEVKAAIMRGAHHPDMLDDPAPEVTYTNFTDNSHDFELLLWIQDATKIPDIKSDVRLQVWDELVKKEIGLPMPMWRLLTLKASQKPTLAPSEKSEPIEKEPVQKNV
jgi:small-conductance mechanosensitive channel